MALDICPVAAAHADRRHEVGLPRASPDAAHTGEADFARTRPSDDSLGAVPVALLADPDVAPTVSIHAC